MAINFFSINGTGQGGGSSKVNTLNGISGDGSVGNEVVLGGNPLDRTTTIDMASHILNFLDSTGNSNLNIVITGSFALPNEKSSYQSGVNEIQMFYIGDTTVVNPARANFVLQNDYNPNNPLAQIYVTNDGGTASRGFLVTTHPGEAIRVVDTIDNIGLVGHSDVNDGSGTFKLYAVQSQYQYAQYGNIASIAAKQDTAGQTTTQIIPPAYTPLVDSIVRVNAYGFYVTGTGSVAITVAYTDRLSNPQTAILGSISSVSPVTSFPATILKVKGGTTVSVTYTVTGTITYDAGGTIENLFT